MEAAKEIKLYPVSDKIIENKKTGFVPLYRSIRDHWIWKESKVKSKFEAWMDLLLSASHDDQKEPVGYDLIVVKKGQVLTSQLILSQSWRWDRSAVRGFLKLLQKDRMIEVKATSKFTMITICNYADYKINRPTKQQQNNINSTSTQHIQPLEPLEPLVSSAIAPQKNNYKKWDEKAFIDDIARYKDHYDRDVLNEFYKHWSEKDEKGKMLFQFKTTWETGKRLATWVSNNKKWSK